MYRQRYTRHRQKNRLLPLSAKAPDMMHKKGEPHLCDKVRLPAGGCKRAGKGGGRWGKTDEKSSEISFGCEIMTCGHCEI